MNRAWAGFTLDDYFYVSSVAMGQTDGTLEADLQNEHLPDGGYAMGTLSGEGDVMRRQSPANPADNSLQGGGFFHPCPPEIPETADAVQGKRKGRELHFGQRVQNRFRIGVITDKSQRQVHIGFRGEVSPDSAVKHFVLDLPQGVPDLR